MGPVLGQLKTTAEGLIVIRFVDRMPWKKRILHLFRNLFFLLIVQRSYEKLELFLEKFDNLANKQLSATFLHQMCSRYASVVWKRKTNLLQLGCASFGHGRSRFGGSCCHFDCSSSRSRPWNQWFAPFVVPHFDGCLPIQWYVLSSSLLFHTHYHKHVSSQKPKPCLPPLRTYWNTAKTYPQKQPENWAKTHKSAHGQQEVKSHSMMSCISTKQTVPCRWITSLSSWRLESLSVRTSF